MLDWLINIFKICIEPQKEENKQQEQEQQDIIKPIASKDKFLYFSEQDNEYFSYNSDDDFSYTYAAFF